jgi:hypothetical protein
MPTLQETEWAAKILGVEPNSLVESASAAPSSSGHDMQHDCKIVRGKVPGPTNHVLCATHHHVLDTTTHKVIAKDLDEYKRKFPAPPHAKASAPHGKAAVSPAANHDKAPQGGEAGKKAEDGKAGGEKAEAGDSGVAVGIFKWLVSKADDATLKAQVGSAMPNGRQASDYTWKGPIKTIAQYPEEKSLLHLSTIAFAEVEVAFYYSGKYINNFHASLTRADVDKTASLSAELTIDDSNVGNSPDRVAHLDWTVTFRRKHFMGSKLVTITGRASGDGAYSTSQPSVYDYVQEAQQQAAANVQKS